jgi:hypothetical protein
MGPGLALRAIRELVVVTDALLSWQAIRGQHKESQRKSDEWRNRNSGHA